MESIDMAENIVELLTDVADAIREKKGSQDKINAQSFAEEIKNLPSGGSKWTGHADVEGLKAIGWTDEDIAYYQQNGVNWNEEDDEYHKVSEDNKALYGGLNANNISTYKERIVYLPKIDISNVISMNNKFQNCYSLVAIPHLDTSNVTSMNNMFQGCYSLVSIPHLDTSDVISMNNMFQSCYSLVAIPHLDTSKVTSMRQMFQGCFSLVSIPHLDTSNVTDTYSMFYNCDSLVSISHLDTHNATNMSYMFGLCYSLVAIPQLDTSKVTNVDYIFQNCYSLATIGLDNTKMAYDLSAAAKLSKESLLYIINNEAATSAITIKLASYAYSRWSADADVVAALNNHPNISISA